ncbi:hypothetical protein B0H13DRAFT_596220 [Mycena leptocephala]|nr:hypothetical protein B0H13DRAFT_596220 [Mycena leptocephala]
MCFTKIGKVMRHIALLQSQSLHGDEFKLRDRAWVLVDKWLQILRGSGPMEVHRCLDVVELVEVICSELRQLRGGMKALAALARTCKKLQGPALDRLWYHQYTLDNIFGCMPADLFETYEEPGGPGITRMRLVRPILLGDWQRPMQYAHRVRVLEFLRADGVASSSILPIVSSCLPNGAWFPNLQTLEWLPNSTDFLIMPMLTSPTITTVLLAWDPSHNNLSLLPTLARTCPALKEIVLDFIVSTGAQRSAVSNFLRTLDGIEILVVQIPDSAAYEHLGQLSTLTSLDVTFSSIEVPFTAHAPGSRFTALQKLSVTVCDGISRSTNFLHACSGLLLTELDAIFYYCPSTSGMDAFCAAIQASCSHTSLVSLDLTTDYPSEGEHDTIIFSNDSIRAFLCFGNLTFISIKGNTGFDFDDAIIANLARSWPCAQTLVLRSCEQRRPSNTLQCLYAIARHCPHLERLDLAFDATVHPTGVPHASQRRLQSFNVGKSPVDPQTLEVARIISAIFPGLGRSGAGVGDGLRFDGDLDEDEEEEQISVDHQYRKYWHEVAKYLPVLVAIRAEERAWAREELGV